MLGEISPIQEVTDAQAEVRTATLGRDDFLRMLVAQLENQDPLNPQDATQFTAQLAQFSSLEQLLSMSDSLDRLALSQQDFTASFQGLSSAGLIGREVLAHGNQLEVGPGSTSLPAFDLQGAATEVVLHVTDANGARVESLELESWASGLNIVSREQLAAANLAPGTYSFEVEARSEDQAVPAWTQVLGRVTGVVPSGEAPGLELGGLTVPFSGIARVRDAEDRP